MVIVGIFSWWYGRGLQLRLARLQAQLIATYDYFSIDLLAKTLFTPFRQISAGGVRGPIGLQLRAFVDRLFSRMIGFVVRTVMIVVGSVALIVSSVAGLAMVVVWVTAPLLPVVGLVLALGGWLPWTL